MDMNQGKVSHSPLLFPGTALLSVLISDHEAGGSRPRGGFRGSPNFPSAGHTSDNLGFVEVIFLLSFLPLFLCLLLFFLLSVAMSLYGDIIYIPEKFTLCECTVQ